MPRGKKHSREELLDAVRKAWDLDPNVDLRPGAVQKSPYRWISRSHHHYFNNWRDFLETAGITYAMVKARVRKKKSRAKEVRKQEYLQGLRKAYEDGIDLNSSVIQAKGNPHRTWYDRAHTFFRGRTFWEQALTKAGLPVEEIVKQRAWDRDVVKDRLLARKKQKKSLRIRAIMEDDYPLYKAAMRHFNNSHKAALLYSGINHRGIIEERGQHTLPEIIEKIIELHLGYQSLSRSDILAGEDKELKRYIYAAQKILKGQGGWERAVVLAGLSYEPYRKRKPRGFWNARTVYEEGLKIVISGEPLDSTHPWKHHSNWVHAAGRYAGGWKHVLETLSPPALEFSQLQLHYVRIAWAVLLHPDGPSLKKETIKARVEGIELLSAVPTLVSVSLRNIARVIGNVARGQLGIHPQEEIALCSTIRQKWPGKTLQEIIQSIPQGDFEIKWSNNEK